MTSLADAVEAIPPFARPDLMEASYAEAAEAGAPCERWLSVGGLAVRVRAASPELLRRLTYSFAHRVLPEAAAAADLTVHLWDSASRGTTPPPLPDLGDMRASGGAFYHYDGERVRAGFCSTAWATSQHARLKVGTAADAEFLAGYPHVAHPSLSVLDVEAGEAWHWVADASRVAYWEEATAIRFVLDWGLREHGILLLHGGAVGTESGGVLLVGKGGSGKSTSTLACLGSGLLYAGDDYVAVDPGAEPYVHSVYTSGKVEPDHAQRLPFLLEALANTNQLDAEKAVVYVHEHWPEVLTPGFPLRAIVAPRVVPGLVQARVVPISRLEGLTALAPSTLFQAKTRARQSLTAMSGLLDRTPCYRLELGSDIPSIPRAIAALLERLADAPESA